MIPENMKKVVSDLLRRTKDGSVNWIEPEPSQRRQFDFVVKLPAYTVALYAYTDSYEKGDGYTFSIVNPLGKVALAFEVANVASNNDAYSDFSVMSELYEAARHKAMGVDTILKDLEERLKGEDPLGKGKPSPRKPGDPIDEPDDLPF